MSLVLALGCTDHGDVEGDDDVAGDDDTAGGGDDDLADDDSAGVPQACEDEVWPDLEVVADEDCCGNPGDALMDMEVTVSFDGETYCGPLHVGHMLDADADGSIDASDSMQAWSLSSNIGAELITHDGQLSNTILTDTRGITGSIGDIDPSSEGMELVVAYDPDWDDEYDKLVLYEGDGDGPVWMVDIPGGSPLRPWLTDLEGDGSVEILEGPYIHDGTTGALLATLDASSPDGAAAPLAADLDLDGVQEILATSAVNYQPAALFAPDGSRLHECWVDEVNWSYFVAAIGNLDDDPAGEIVLAGRDMVRIFDSDCTELTSASFDLFQPSVLGIGELDGDEQPEIVLSSSGDGILTLDHDLTFRWSWEKVGQLEHHHPFALADLDADGLHEILIRTYPEFIVLDGAGTQVFSITPTDSHCGSWIGAPSVVDIDADGLAEIVMPAWPTMAIVENDFGGWPLDGSDEPWTWVEKFPGSRTPDGQVPTPTTRPWQDPHTNVWQALPVGSSAVVPHPDLVLGDIDVCTEEDSNRALVTAYLANQGPLTIYEDVANFAYRPTDGTFLDDSVLQPPLLSGQSRPIQFSIHVDDLADGLEIRADVLEDISECEEGNNSATWSP